MNCCLKSLQNINKTEWSGEKSQQEFDPSAEISIEIDRNVEKSTEDWNLKRNLIRLKNLDKNPPQRVCIHRLGMRNHNYIDFDLHYFLMYLIYAGLGKLSQANEYLSQAQWTVLKTPECGNEIKSRLYRNLGQLEAAQKNYSEALCHLSNDVSIFLLVVKGILKIVNFNL